MGLFKKIKSIFIKEEKIDYSGIVMPEDISNEVKDYSYDQIADPILYGNLESKKTFLLMDDLEDVFYLYRIDFKNIKEKYGYDILKEFKIVKCSGDNAGFIADKYLQNNDDELVIALLDITLGKIIKLDTGEVLSFDGVDIALTIMNQYPKCSIKFCSAHRLNKKNPEILKFIDKFENATQLDISDFYFSKNSDRASYIYEMLPNKINE